MITSVPYIEIFGHKDNFNFMCVVRSLMNCPLCKGKETVACYNRCRYEDKPAGTWKGCLTKCLDNPLILGMFLKMLPDMDDTEEPKEAQPEAPKIEL